MSNTNNPIDSTDSELREAATALNDAAVKERMAKKIVANSEAYSTTDRVIEDFPTKKSLATKLNQVAPGIAEQVDTADPATNAESDDLTMFGSDAE